MAFSGRLYGGCGCRSIGVFGGNDLLPSFTRCSSQKLSFPAFSQPNYCNRCQVSREKTCLEFIPPNYPSCAITERWICFAGGGKRPRRPRIWKSRNKRGSFRKSDKLLESLESVSNVKEEVYGVLDAFVAWELDFPLIPIKKAINVLEREGNWPRIIQIIKWMLGKGQGRTMGTYKILLKAFSAENRIDEAQELFKKVFSRHLECTPITIFSEMMRMYERHEMYEDILEVFADMEELNVRLTDEISGIVSRTYKKIGDMDRAQRVIHKYAGPKFRWRTIGGTVVKFRNVERDVTVSRWMRNDNLDHQAGNVGDLAVSSWTRADDSGHQRMENGTDAYGHIGVHHGDGMRAQEDAIDYGNADDGESEIEEEYEQGDELAPAQEAYHGYFSASLASENEMYV